MRTASGVRVTTTLNTYGHLWPPLGDQLDGKIDRVLVEARRSRPPGRLR
ncbi:MAG TPA: hypothetical protein VFV02_04210 [Acidimicrobiales bacterium]|nr:hypothetical protein [Acidimicrobiales bacterium]